LEIEGAADEKTAAPAVVLGQATLMHFRSETVNKYMRHYNGDADNFTQDYMDSDTLWSVYPVVGTDNEVVVKHGSRNRWLSYNPALNNDDRLFVPDTLPEDDKVWILIEAPEDAGDSGPDPNEDIYTQGPRVFSILLRSGTYLMHHRNNSSITTQSYEDTDTLWKAIYTSTGILLKNNSQRYLANDYTSVTDIKQAARLTIEAKSSEGKQAATAEPATFLEW
jgi:hypothetical protein